MARQYRRNPIAGNVPTDSAPADTAQLPNTPTPPASPGETYLGGNYRGRAANLNAKQLRNAGGAAAVQAAGNKVSISDTKWVKGVGVVGRDGKPFTGSVDMGGGQIAVYVNGRRVRVAKPKPKGAPTAPAGPAASGGGNANPRTRATYAQSATSTAGRYAK